MKTNNRNTSWQGVGKWYGQIVGEKGHYYHQKIILPNVIRLLGLKEGEKLLDIGCGQGILARSIPENIEYTGIDLAPNLIEEAKRMDKDRNHIFKVADATKELNYMEVFDKAAVILAVQNMEKPFGMIKNAYKALKKGGRLVMVINHPAFRIPKNSDWGVDREKRIQFRKLWAYMNPIKIPIESNPFHGEKSETTWSFHYPLSAYTEMIHDNGFLIENIEEWISDKKSEGGAAAMEDKARKEIPLFMAISCIKSA
ncbi:MAG TPA: class I SAM-dependent methyltransferase [Patescibacteria group bacterium]